MKKMQKEFLEKKIPDTIATMLLMEFMEYTWHKS